MHITRTEIYLEILILKEAKDVIYENFCKFFRFTKNETYSKLNEEKNLRKLTRIMHNNLKDSMKAKEFIKSPKNK